MEYLVIWLICGFVTGAIALARGLVGGFGWFIFGVLFGPFGIVLALVAKDDPKITEAAAIQSGEMKKCPSCAELVKTEAVKCRFCGENFNT